MTFSGQSSVSGFTEDDEPREPEPDPDGTQTWKGKSSLMGRAEATVALREMESREAGDYGSYAELRQWISDLPRLGAYSKEVMLKTSEGLLKLLTADRGPKATISRENLQQAFIRMQGFKQTMSAMCLQLDDPEVVASLTNLLAAAVQGAPHNAEFISEQVSELRLLWRAIERHAYEEKEVAVAGCELIVHLCSLTPYMPCPEHVPPRTKAHRDTQKRLAAEGAIDVLASLLGTSVREAEKKFEVLRLQEAATMHQVRVHKDRAAAPTVVGRRNSETARNEKKKQQESIQRAKNNVEVRQKWRDLADTEIEECKLQMAALQALILLSASNSETTRMLCSSLAAEKHIATAEPAEEPAPTGGLGAAMAGGEHHPGNPQAPHGERRSVLGRRFSRSNNQHHHRSASKTESVGSHLHEDAVAQPTEILQALGHATSTLTSVLRSGSARDRPILASRAARLIYLIAEHQLSIAQRVNEQSKITKQKLEAKLHTQLGNDSVAGAPPMHTQSQSQQAHSRLTLGNEVDFETVRDVVAALVAVLRLHPDDPPLVSASIQALATVRAVCLEASIAAGRGRSSGVSEDALQRWRVLLHGTETEGELSKCSKFLKDALRSTEVVKSRMSTCKVDPETLVGDGVYLTPRAEADVKRAKEKLAELTADLVAVDWNERERERQEQRKLKRLMQEHDAALEGSDGASDMLHDGRLSSKGSSWEGRRSSKGSMFSVGGGSKKSASRKSTKGSQMAPAPIEEMDEVEAPSLGGAWSQPVGYDAYTSDQLESHWRAPLEAAFGRSFPKPAVPARRKTVLGQPSPKSSSAVDSLDRLMELEFMSSEPGKIRARLLVQPQDSCQQTAYLGQLRELSDDTVSAGTLTTSLSKSLKREGFLMPRYGMRVRVRKARSEDQKRIIAERSLSAPLLQRVVGTVAQR
eukprot:CAMPEP_0206532612 /NCGR_PEP_ID=MMETSP0325_2-20121206/4487_1 /ASSEMBLY_ACC=CAM_ASM_000347 /TAXON_ID=2866 /ORGANISM="Crypthecodinium cohnii, Strain Seligo" /LENGTH=921 /DNA_ID=CAMNT_0054029125 /DNA_START=117 /DNA_END=2882 /DNA_ORIENTATION=+